MSFFSRLIRLAIFCLAISLSQPSSAQLSGGGSGLSPAELAELKAEFDRVRAEKQIIAANPEMVFKYQQYASPQGGYIEANGMITPGSIKKLQAAVLKAEENGKVFYIELNSLGGDLITAIMMGEFLRSRRIDTSVGPETICLSACAIVFLGGEKRTVNVQEVNNDFRNAIPEKDGPQNSLGFHSFRFGRDVATSLSPAAAEELADDTARTTQLTLGDLARYIAKMEVDPQIIQLAAPYGTREFLYPSLTQLATLRIQSGHSDGGDFKLVPDGARTNAIYREGQNQLILACEYPALERPRAVAIISTLIWNSQADHLKKWDMDLRATSIFSSTQLQWTPYDIDHKHYHAGNSFPDWYAEAAFGLIHTNESSDDEGGVPHDLSPKTTRFFVSKGAFHIVYQPNPEFINYMRTAPLVDFTVRKSWADNGTISIHAHNGTADSESIAFALKDCSP